MTFKMTRKTSKKNTSISIKSSQNLSDEENYLPLKYPIRNSQKKCENIIKNFKINSQDQNEAGSSKTYNCATCNLLIKLNQNSIKCNGPCECWYHFKCSKLDIKYLDNLKKNDSKWFCNKCEKNTIEKSNIAEILKSLNFLSEKYDEIYKDNLKMSSTLFEIKKSQEELRQENILLKKEIVVLKEELKHQQNIDQQQTLKNKIEIQGIPKMSQITDEQITNKILNHISATIEYKDILEINRPKNKNENIIKIKFRNEETRNEVIKKSKQYFKNKGKLCTSDLKIPGNRNIIYINEELTPKTKFIFGKSKELKEYGFKYVWIKNGKIFVRKNDQEKIINITTEAQIKEILDLNSF